MFHSRSLSDTPHLWLPRDVVYNQRCYSPWCNRQHYGFWYRHSRFESWWGSFFIWGGEMKRFAILSTALCVMLSGCTTEQPLNDDTTPNIESGTPSESAADKPQAQAFVFESGVLEIGDFDPYTIGDDIFDPCTEITQEEFTAAGFEEVEPVLEKYAGISGGLKSCFLTSQDGENSATISNNVANRPVIEDAYGTEERISTILPELYVYSPRFGTSTSCFAQVDTLRGGVAVIASGLEMTSSNESNCAKAQKVLENLFAAHSSGR